MSATASERFHGGTAKPMRLLSSHAHDADHAASTPVLPFPPYSFTPELADGLSRLHFLIAHMHDQDLLVSTLNNLPELRQLFIEQIAASRTDTSAQKAGAMSLETALGYAQPEYYRRFIFGQSLLDLMPPAKNVDLVHIAMQRALFLELTAMRSRDNVQPEIMFLTGLLSTLDSICSMAMEDLLSVLDPPDAVISLLADVWPAPMQPGSENRDSSAGLLLLLQCIESGLWNACTPLLEQHGIAGQEAATLYGKAAIWAHLTLSRSVA